MSRPRVKVIKGQDIGGKNTEECFALFVDRVKETNGSEIDEETIKTYIRKLGQVDRGRPLELLCTWMKEESEKWADGHRQLSEWGNRMQEETRAYSVYAAETNNPEETHNVTHTVEENTLGGTTLLRHRDGIKAGRKGTGTRVCQKETSLAVGELRDSLTISATNGNRGRSENGTDTIVLPLSQMRVGGEDSEERKCKDDSNGHWRGTIYQKTNSTTRQRIPSRGGQEDSSGNMDTAKAENAARAPEDYIRHSAAEDLDVNAKASQSLGASYAEVAYKNGVLADQRSDIMARVEAPTSRGSRSGTRQRRVGSRGMVGSSSLPTPKSPNKPSSKSGNKKPLEPKGPVPRFEQIEEMCKLICSVEENKRPHDDDRLYMKIHEARRAHGKCDIDCSVEEVVQEINRNENNAFLRIYKNRAAKQCLYRMSQGVKKENGPNTQTRSNGQAKWSINVEREKHRATLKTRGKKWDISVQALGDAAMWLQHIS